MGHYHDCYEFDAQKEFEERTEFVNNQFQSYIEGEISTEDKEFLIEVANNIDDFRAMFRLFKNKKLSKL